MTDSRPLALVTGASSGIGHELARQFAENGFDVIVNAEDVGLAAAAQELRGTGGVGTKTQGLAAKVLPDSVQGVLHRNMAQPGSGQPGSGEKRGNHR